MAKFCHPKVCNCVFLPPILCNLPYRSIYAQPLTISFQPPLPFCPRTPPTNEDAVSSSHGNLFACGCHPGVPCCQRLARTRKLSGRPSRRLPYNPARQAHLVLPTPNKRTAMRRPQPFKPAEAWEDCSAKRGLA